MMKTKNIFLMILWLSVAGSLLSACCDDQNAPWHPEISDSEEELAVGNGRFVVSYSTTDDASTRALSDTALPANKRISSLHYYVYDNETGNLVKKRRIRGINEKTTWPINNRTSMSWELRQDLQDTLMAGPTYRILFIANIDSTLFGEKHPPVVRHEEKYETAQILLPQVPFSDHNMYYLWEGELTGDPKAPTTVKRQDVWLRRLVTRTDVERKEIADLSTHLYNAIVNSLYKNQEKEANLKKLMSKHIQDFTVRIDGRMNGDYEVYANQLRDLLRQEAIQETLFNALKRTIAKQYATAILNSQLAATIKEWPQTGTVTTDYQTGTRTNVLFFNKIADKDANMKQTEDLEITGGTFTIIGFSGDEIKTMNGIDKLTFKIPETDATFEISDATLWLKGGFNTRHKAICNPVVGITIKDTAPTDLKPTLNFIDALKDIPKWVELSNFKLEKVDKTLFEMVIDRVFNDNGLSDKFSHYGTDFTNFEFTNFRIPNITEANAHAHVTITPSWSYE